MRRTLGRSGIEVSAAGMGCWAIGGPFLMDGRPDGWGDVNDATSVRAIQRATELGITFFDTADVYGTGHSERVLGQALKDQRDKVVIATKFGYTYNETTKEITGTNLTPAYIRRACEASLKRLQTDYIDLYQLHVGDAASDAAETVWETPETLRNEGWIRTYGWSTGDPGRADALARRSSAGTLQHAANILLDASDIFATCAEHDLASISNSPLAMGLLSGKFTPSSQLPKDDVRGGGQPWVHYFHEGKPKQEFLAALEAVRAILTSGGRTLPQGALAWLWARSPRTVPIPGFKTVPQAEENARALSFGPLTADQMRQIDELLYPR